MNTAAEHPGSLRRAEETPHFQGPHGHQHFRCSGRAPGWTSGPSREGVRDSQTGPVQMLHTTSANTLLLDSEPTPSPTQKWLKNQRSQVWAAVWPSQTSPWAVSQPGGSCPPDPHTPVLAELCPWPSPPTLGGPLSTAHRLTPAPIQVGQGGAHTWLREQDSPRAGPQAAWRAHLRPPPA